VGRKLGFEWARKGLGSIPVLSAGVWDGESVWGAVETGKVERMSLPGGLLATRIWSKSK
jgi:hypothetical protein